MTLAIPMMMSEIYGTGFRSLESISNPAVYGVAIVLLTLYSLTHSLYTYLQPLDEQSFEAPELSWSSLVLFLVSWMLGSMILITLISSLTAGWMIGMKLFIPYVIQSALGLLFLFLWSPSLPNKAIRLFQKTSISVSNIKKTFFLFGVTTVWIIFLQGAAQFFLGPQKSQEALRSLIQIAGNKSLFIMGFTIVIIAPIFEEFIFRGILFSWFMQRYRLIVSVVLSSFLFGLLHWDPVASPIIMVLGIALAMAYRITGNIWVSIGIHALWNLGAFVIQVSGRYAGW